MAELAGRCAIALFNIAIENEALDEYVGQATLVRDTLSDERVMRIITHPHITNNEKRNFLNELFQDKLSGNMMGFLDMAIRKNREIILVDALSQFIDMGNTRNKKAVASVISATPLSREKIETLQGVLSKKLDKQVEISASVDPSLIGGLYIHVDGFLIDQTINRHLRNMKINMKREVPHESQA